MLDLPAPSEGPGGSPAEAIDRSPVVVLDATRTPRTGLLAQWAPGSPDARRSVVVGVLGDDRPSPELMQVLDVALAPPGSAAASTRGTVASDDIDGDVAALEAMGTHSPQATWALARLLRVTAVVPAAEGVAAESATYSSLLSSGEFRRWRESTRRARRSPDHDEERVRVARTGDVLEVVLTRPSRRNAYDAHMRDALLEALTLAVLAPEVQVALRGAGRDFCAGGDLDEFGTAGDPALAHRLRVGAHPGLAIDAIRERVTAHLHGHCIGSGIEMAAFAGRVLATEDTVLGLPELSMGLVPGAGGTVSLTRRIGRHRVLWWAMSGRRIGLDLALEWGLVDGADA